MTCTYCVCALVMNGPGSLCILHTTFKKCAVAFFSILLTIAHYVSCTLHTVNVMKGSECVVCLMIDPSFLEIFMHCNRNKEILDTACCT